MRLKTIVSIFISALLVVTTAAAQTVTHATIAGTSSNPAMAGTALTLFTVVAPQDAGAPLPTGSVDFFADGVKIGSALLVPVNGNGVASLSASSLQLGSHEITSSYQGSAAYSASASTAFTQVITANVAFQLSPDVVVATAAPGQTASFNLTASTSTGFTATITYACNNNAVPLGNCSFAPTSSSISPGTNGSTALSVSTATPQPALASIAGSPLLLVLLLAPAVGFAFHSSARKSCMLMLLTLGVLALGSTGCGGSPETSSASPGTPPGAYTIHVFASSGLNAPSTDVVLVVR